RSRRRKQRPSAARARDSCGRSPSPWAWACRTSGGLGGREAAYVHRGENLADRRHCAAHVLGIEPADAADAEALSDGELAGIDDVASLSQRVVEGLELEVGVFGHAERDDDRRLQLLRQQGLEAERLHA